ncbi:MAG: FAD-dependent oxidoreductase [Nitrospinales bacterium]
MQREKAWVVLGAGPAGLTAAYELASKGKSVLVFEEREFIGGASATIYKDGFAYDFGPHAYHIKGTEIDTLFEKMAPGTLARKTIDQKLVVENSVISYPLKFYELIRSLHPLRSARMVFDYLVSTITYALLPFKDSNFEAWGIKRFGYSLYNLCFGQYTQRVWGISPVQLSATLASSKLHKLNLWDIILKLLGFTGQEQATHWSQFYYPEKGIGEIWKSMSREIADLGGRVCLNSPVKTVHVKSGQVESITIANSNGQEKVYGVEKIISTIPLGKLANMMRGADDEKFSRLGDSLKYVSLITVNMAFNTAQCQESHWVYLLDPRFRFNRISEQKNLGSECSPRDKTHLSFEMTCFEENDPMQFADDAFMERLALKEVDKIAEIIPQINRKNHCGTEVIRMRNVYPMYTLGFEENLDRLIEQFSQIKNMILTGRHGLFLNSDMHDSMEMGKKAAQYLLEDPPDNEEWYRMAKSYVNFKVSKVKS